MANGFTFRSRDAPVDCIWQRCFVLFLCLWLARVLLLLLLLLVALLCLLALLVALQLLPRLLRFKLPALCVLLVCLFLLFLRLFAPVALSLSFFGLATLPLLLTALLCLLSLLVALKLLLCLLGLIDRRALCGGQCIGGDQRRSAGSSPGWVAQSALRLRRCILPDLRLLLAC